MTEQESFEYVQKLAHSSSSLFSKIENVSGFNTPKRCTIDFKRLHEKIIADPLPETLKHLIKKSDKGRDWLTIFRSAILGNVQEGLTASYYHLLNIESIENEMIAIASKEIQNIDLKNGGISGGNTSKLNYEYQAFVFALRRTLEYLASSISSFFKCEGNRIRHVEKMIKGREPKEINEKISKIVSKAIVQLADILPSNDDGLSVRDTLAHWKAVDAGIFNISEHDDEIIITLVGGGEKLEMKKPIENVNNSSSQKKCYAIISLTPIIENQISRVENLIRDIYIEMKLIQ